MQRFARAWAWVLGGGLVIAACSGGETQPQGSGGARSSGSTAVTSSGGGGASSTSGGGASSSSGGGGASSSSGGGAGAGGAMADAGMMPDADGQGDADAGEAPDAGADPCTSNGLPTPAGTPCDDGDPCNGMETCDGTGQCVAGAPPILDDGNPCTLDACDPQLGVTHSACSAVDPTVATIVAAASSFLITGPNPPQTGVAPGTIDQARAAIVRGQVATASGSPLVGAAVSVLGHPEYGATTTFADGMFTMLVNGGGALTVAVASPGLIPAQRTVDVPWNDYARAGDVVLIAYDPAVTAVDLASADPIQIAQGSVSTDADGTRRATLMFAAGTAAMLTLPGGAQQSLTGAAHVRATEFTVGAAGLAAMPGTLPPTSAYTYAVELSVDEALAAGATRVDFDQPVAVYVDNFLGFPAGTIVPTGSYDPAAGAWVASANGRVIAVVSEAGGLADLDANGDGVADDAAALAALGIADAERAELAILYAPGDSVWRFAVQHFTSWDANQGYGPPDDGCAPFDPTCGGGGGNGGAGGGGSGSSSSGSGSSSGGNGGTGGNGSDPVANRPIADPCEQPGSVIECQNQILGESLPVSGTPFRLHYRSDRVPGRTASYSLTIPLAGASLPASLQRIDLTVDVAGRSFTSSTPCPCAPNAVTTFTWDGRDVFGRLVQGAQPVTATIGYVYEGVYANTPRFGLPGSGTAVPASKTRREVVLKKVWSGTLGVVQDDRARHLGGWSLSAHDVYDPAAKIVYRGDGTRQQADAHGPVIRTVAGGNGFGLSGDGGPATKAKLNWPAGIALAPDGTLFVADGMNSRIRKVDPGGTISLVTGGILGPSDVKVGPDGSLYVAELGAHRIDRIAPDGVITILAGTGLPGFAGDGGPAAAAQLDGPISLAVARDGMLYLADGNNRRVRVIGTDGTIATIAGGGTLAPADGMPATQAYLGHVQAVALGLDGALFVAAGDGAGAVQIFRVGVDGKLGIVAGTGEAGNEGDGGPARQATFGAIVSLAAAPDGALYVVDSHTTMRVRHIAADGTIAAFAGVGQGAFANESGPAAASKFGVLWGIALAPDGAVYLSDQGGASRVFRVAPVLPGVPRAAQSFVVAAADGRTLDAFDGSGRHLQTLDARTGAALYTFGYDAAGRLASVTDVAGLATTIQRDANGDPTAIVAPHGQTTGLALDAGGWLGTVTDPALAATQLGYGTGGLLTSLTDAKLQAHGFTYDAFGWLLTDADPAGASKTLVRSTAGGVDTVTVTTKLGRTSTYVTGTGGRDRTIKLPNGTTAAQHRGLDEKVTSTSPDGTAVTAVRAADPRFGLQAPFVTSEVTTTPGGLVRTVTRQRSASLSDPADLMSFTTLTETTTINGHTFTSLYDKASRTLTETSPLHRVVTTSFDAAGRVTGVNMPGLLALMYGYDGEGRLGTVTRGTRIWTRAYDPQTGELASVTDPLTQVTSYLRDAVGRVTTTTRPDLASIGTGYDANGNETTVTPPGTPPGAPAHVLDYTPVDKLSSYSPPGTTATTWGYDLDGQLSTVTRPDGLVVGYTPDAAGRLGTVTLPAGQGSLGYAYSPTSGHLDSITGPAGITLTYGHDGALRTDRVWSGAALGSVHHDHDADFRVSAETVSGGGVVSFGYDDDGLLTQAGDLTLARDPQSGQLTGVTLGAVSDAVTYDGFGDVDTYEAKAGAVTLYAVTYPMRDALGRIIERVETLAGQSHTFDYAYDPAGRLTDVLEDGALAAHYDYDANGNRTGATTASGSVTGTYDAQDRLVSFGSKTYAFTLAGELVSVTDAATGQSLGTTYDALGNLRQVVLGDGTVIDYVVDGEKHRIWKRKNGVPVQGFLWSDALRVAAELDAGGTVVARFVYGTRANVPDAMIRGGKTYRILTDHVGSPRLVVDSATGTVVQQVDYDALGRVTGDTNPGWQPFGFAGGLYDRDTGLTRFGVRDYDAETGRWTARDPLRFDAGDSNLYAYCRGDPVNRVDPDGRFDTATCGALSVAIMYACRFAGGGREDCIRIAQAAGEICRNTNPGEPNFTRDPGAGPPDPQDDELGGVCEPEKDGTNGGGQSEGGGSSDSY